MHLVILALAALPAHDPATVSVGVLRAAVEQWQSEVAFRSTFRLRSGRAPSLEAALRGEIDPDLAPPHSPDYFEATGTFNKMGQKLRYSIDYGHAPLEVPGPDVIPGQPTNQASVRTVTNVSFDEVTDQRLGINHTPGKGFMADTVGIGKRRGRVQGTSNAGEFSVGAITPLNPMGTLKGDPFELWLLNPRSGKARAEVATVDAEHIDVTLSHTEPDGTAETRLVRFWTKPSPPVVERIHYVSVWKGTRSEDYAVLSDFKQCPGGMVARHVISVQKSSMGNSVSLKDWVSKDLGNSQPTEEDFVVVVPPQTAIGGLKSPPPPGSERRLDIRKISLSDVSNPVIAPPSPPLSVRAAEQNRGFAERARLARTSHNHFWFIFVNLVIVFAIAGSLLLLRYRKKRGA